jgi:S-adenosylmethionine decarboxylase
MPGVIAHRVSPHAAAVTNGMRGCRIAPRVCGVRAVQPQAANEWLSRQRRRVRPCDKKIGPAPFFSCNRGEILYNAIHKLGVAAATAARAGVQKKGGSSLHALGRHLLVELHGCHPDSLKKVDLVKDILVGAARACGATIVDVAFHEFNPFGVSGVVVIAESHLSIHTWPEYRYAAVDIFTCGDVIKPEYAAAYIASRFRCRNPSIVEMKRGLIPGVVGKVAHKVGAATLPVSEGASDAAQELSLVH